MIIDSTRRGKRFPDSMSKTIPIWTCVLNRSVYSYISKRHFDDSLFKGSDDPYQHIHSSRQLSHEWDCSLHLPLWVSETEKAAIENRLEEWTKQLEESGADIASLVSCLKKPLRPLWISQRTVIWLNEVPNYDSWDFTPVMLVSASSSNGIQLRTTSEFSWSYIPGAGDDEESWARGLSPNLFWNHVYDLITSGSDLCNRKVAEIVEKDRVHRAQRGQDAPQVTVKPSKLPGGLNNLSLVGSLLSPDISKQNGAREVHNEESMISWLASTKLAVGTSQCAANMINTVCTLNCDQESISVHLPNSEGYLHLPMVNSKLDRFSILSNLPSAVSFAKMILRKGKALLVCCHNGEDISVCICLAILMSLYDQGGTFDDGKSFKEACLTKAEMQKRLVFICKYAVNARPSRGNLKQVFAFLRGINLN